MSQFSISDIEIPTEMNSTGILLQVKCLNRSYDQKQRRRNKGTGAGDRLARPRIVWIIDDSVDDMKDTVLHPHVRLDYTNASTSNQNVIF